MNEEIVVSKEAANAAYLILWEFLSQNGKIPGIERDHVAEFTNALGSANRIVIGE
jgi:hypothetical protein